MANMDSTAGDNHESNTAGPGAVPNPTQKLPVGMVLGKDGKP